MVENTDLITSSIQAWNGNFNKLDKSITSEENQIEALSDNFKTNKAQGKTLELEDSASAGIVDIKIGENTELEQKTVINLFDKDTATYVNSKYKNDNGVETSSSISGYLSSYVEVEANKKYTIQGTMKTSSSNAAIYYYDASKNWISKEAISSSTELPYTFTTPASCKYIQFQYTMSVYNASTVMIELGSTASEYQPYTNGASPTPDYPQPIKVVEGSNTLVSQSKNIVNFANFSDLRTTHIFENDILTISSSEANAQCYYNILEFFKTHPGETIHFGFESLDASGYTSTASGIAQMDVIDNGVRTYTRMLSKNGTATDYIIPSDTSKVTQARFKILTNDTSTATNSTLIFVKPQLELGTVSTEYVKYAKQSYPITLPEGMFLGSIGEASNYIYGDIDNWKLHSGLAKGVIDETTNIVVNTLGEDLGNRFYTTQFSSTVLRPSSNSRKVDIKSNLLIAKSANATYSGTEGISFAANGTLYFYMANYKTYDVDAIKTWLGTHNLIFYYPLATETDIAIIDTTLINQLNDLKRNMTTYKNKTIIFIATDNLQPNINLTYRIEDKTIKNELDMLKSNFDIKTSENSNSLNITDAINYYNQGNIKIGDGPALEQFTTSGKNLLNTKGGFTKAYISNTGVVTNDPKNALFDGYISVQANSNYTFSANDSIKATNISYFDSSQNFISRDKIENQSSATVTTPANTEYVRINVQYNDNNISQTIVDSLDMMFEAGSTATSYEPYTGGQASPNPDYPQDIVVVEGNSTLNVSNKNVFDKANVNWYRNNSSNFSAVSNSMTDRIRTNSFSILGGKTYTISGYPSSVTLNAIRAYNSMQTRLDGAVTRNGDTFTLTDEVAYIHLLFNGSDFDSTTNELMKNADIQLELGSTATSYVQHKQPTYPITLPTGMFLGKIDTASNYIYGAKDNWKLHSGLAKSVLDGTETWSYAGSSVWKFRYLTTNGNFTNIATEYPVIMSNYFTKGIWNSSANKQISATSTSAKTFAVRYDDMADLDAFKTWLGTHNLIVYYPIIVAETDITDSTLVTQLNNIVDNLQTYKGGTVVFTTSENLESNIQFDYMVNPLSAIEARLDLLEA